MPLQDQGPDFIAKVPEAGAGCTATGHALGAATKAWRASAGVYGSVTSLVKVPEQKYRLALAVTLGREMDSIIVEDAKAAKACIKYLQVGQGSRAVIMGLQQLLWRLAVS